MSHVYHKDIEDGSCECGSLAAAPKQLVGNQHKKQPVSRLSRGAPKYDYVIMRGESSFPAESGSPRWTCGVYRKITAELRGKLSPGPAARQGWRNSAPSLRSTLLVTTSYIYLYPALPKIHNGQSYKRWLRSSLLSPPSTLTCSGTLVRCDASIKAMLIDIDSKNNNEYIIEDLDEEHILVKETKVTELKGRLHNVSGVSDCVTYLSHTNTLQMMRERLKEPESSDSE
jgi:TFIIH basal transcription factor complex TTD-A subunit